MYKEEMERMTDEAIVLEVLKDYQPRNIDMSMRLHKIIEKMEEQKKTSRVVFLVIESRRQFTFTDRNGVEAEPNKTAIAAYDDEDIAKHICDELEKKDTAREKKELHEWLAEHPDYDPDNDFDPEYPGFNGTNYFVERVYYNKEIQEE